MRNAEYLAIAGIALIAGCSGPSAPVAAPPSEPTPPLVSQLRPTDRELLHWRFDSADPLADSDSPGVSGAIAVVASKNGGALREVRPGADGTGGAVKFPDVCVGDSCPHVTVEGRDDPALDPGVRPFVIGVAVKVEREDITKDHGSNLAQKGIASSPQWKVQLDGGGDGRPSCVIRTTGGGERVEVKSSVAVADGRWHHITCRRTDSALQLSVDGTPAGEAQVPAGYVVDPAGHPLTVGSKGPGTNNDQFHGQLDDVFFAIG